MAVKFLLSFLALFLVTGYFCEETFANLRKKYDVLPFSVDLDSEVNVKFEAAQQRLKEKIAKNYISTQKFNLSADRDEAIREVQFFETQNFESGKYKINTDYLGADPYLSSHSFDVHQEYPKDISWRRTKAIKETLSLAASEFSEELESVFSHLKVSPEVEKPAMCRTKQTVRKRIQRLYDRAEMRAKAGAAGLLATSPLGDLGMGLAQSSSRCLDGIQSGLWLLEAQDQGLEVSQSAGDFMSRVFTDYAMNFIELHGKLSDDREFQTTAPQVLKQRMLYALPLRGTEAEIAFPNLGKPRDLALQPRKVMRRFLAGGEAKLANLNMAGEEKLVFEPFDIEKMLALLQASRASAFVNLSGRTHESGLVGEKLTNLQIEKFCQSDPVLHEAYCQFFSETDAPNFYFERAPDSENPSNFRLKDAFWLYNLEKFGFIKRMLGDPDPTSLAPPPITLHELFSESRFYSQETPIDYFGWQIQGKDLKNLLKIPKHFLKEIRKEFIEGRKSVLRPITERPMEFPLDSNSALASLDKQSIGYEYIFDPADYGSRTEPIVFQMIRPRPIWAKPSYFADPAIWGDEYCRETLKYQSRGFDFLARSLHKKCNLGRALTGDVDSQVNLGEFYEAEKDPHSALIWYEKAAAAGSVKAQSLLSRVDFQAFATILKKVQNRDDFTSQAQASVQLAQIYLKGNLWLEKDPQKFLDLLVQNKVWCEAEALTSKPDAQFCVGLFYLKGLAGYPKAEEQSKVWFERAANQNHILANEYLIDLQLPRNKVLRELSNLGIQFVNLPGGVFLMGGARSPGEGSLKNFQHEVTLSPFSVMDTHLTREQWWNITGQVPGMVSEREGSSWVLSCPQCPATCLSYDDLEAAKIKMAEKGVSVRLMTEAEQEYLMRLKGTEDSWGIVNAPFPFETARVKKNAWFSRNSDGKIQPVKTTQQVAFEGLFDVRGNVNSWVSDWYGDYSVGPEVDPQGPEAGRFRVYRGGSVRNNRRALRSDVRQYREPELGDPFIGARWVILIPE